MKAALKRTLMFGTICGFLLVTTACHTPTVPLTIVNLCSCSLMVAGTHSTPYTFGDPIVAPFRSDDFTQNVPPGGSVGPFLIASGVYSQTASGSCGNVTQSVDYAADNTWTITYCAPGTAELGGVVWGEEIKP
jgi:hypothetical protein